MIRPADVHEILAYGSGSMGDVTDASAGARFSLPDASTGYSVKSILVRAIANITPGIADLYLRVVSPVSSVFHFTPLVWQNFGLGATADESEIFVRFDEEEMADMAIYRDKNTGLLGEFCLEWTNPTDMFWSAAFRLVDHANIQNHS